MKGMACLMLLVLLGGVCGEKVQVSIKNKLGNGTAMTIHCQSKDSDLGNQTVADGTEYGWDFSPNVWGTTLFYCDMKWDQEPQFHFVAYASHRDAATRCQSCCSWLTSREGMYGLNGQTGFWEFIYNFQTWPNKQKIVS
ncbi:self-incompatibility protein S1-like [Diospyros lotus]|uniref:self-incompatibility protein S1-like n=1 Tax=Diospyros lotus TaxID=55363 RepID=UPI0022588C12|nr:self-incompatibility protein S1-like [Diospyros lotus]